MRGLSTPLRALLLSTALIVACSDDSGDRAVPPPLSEAVEELAVITSDNGSGSEGEGPVHVTFVNGSRSAMETQVTVRLDLPADVTLAGTGRLARRPDSPAASVTRGPDAPAHVTEDGSQTTYLFPTPELDLGQDVFLQLGPFVHADAESASIEVDMAAWLERTDIDAQTGGEAEVLPEEILSADPGIGELHVIAVQPHPGFGSVVRFYFAGDIEGTWVAGSDAGVAAALSGVHGASEAGELVERGDLAVVVQPVWDIEQLRGTVTLTRWDEDALVQESAGILLRPVAEE